MSSKEITQEQIDRYHQDVDDIIRKSGFAVQGVIGIGTYTIGLLPSRGFEIVTALPANTGCNLTNEAVSIDGLQTDRVYESSSYTASGGGALRFILREMNKKECSLLWASFTLGASRRYTFESTDKLLLLQVADANNILPGEEDYDWYDQSAEEIIQRHNKGANDD